MINIPGFDVNKIREDFPILKQRVNEHPLIYLDNAATTQKPKAVIDRTYQFYSNDYANVHRGVHALSERSTLQYEQAREKVQAFLNAPKREEIVFLRGTTEAVNLVANSYVRPAIKPGDEILITEMEHHSNLVPWQMLCHETGATLTVVPFDDDGVITPQAVKDAITENTIMLAICHISNALGTINPIKEIVKIAHTNEVPVFVDGAQAAPHMKIDVQDLDCDFYAFSGHKAYGPTGIGALYARLNLLEKMAPYQGGGEMIQEVTHAKTIYQQPPFKFEAGTPNFVGAIGMAAAIDYLTAIGFDKITAYEQALLEYATNAIEKVNGVQLYGRASDKASLVTFNIEGIQAQDLGVILNSLGVAIRCGHHCAMPVMTHYKVAATARASFGIYNTTEEVDRFVEALKETDSFFKKV